MQDLEHVPPIICRAEDRNQVRLALMRQQEIGILPNRIDVKWTALPGGRIMAQVVVPKAPVTARKPQSVASDMGKALMFAAVLATVPLALLAGLVIMLMRADVNWSAAGSLIVAGVIVMLVLANRVGHSGACAGIHCDGCRSKR